MNISPEKILRDRKKLWEREQIQKAVAISKVYLLECVMTNKKMDYERVWNVAEDCGIGREDVKKHLDRYFKKNEKIFREITTYNLYKKENPGLLKNLAHVEYEL